MGRLVLYVVARFVVFGVLFAALWLVGLDPFVAAAVAVVASIPVSYVVLRGLRDSATAALQARAQTRAERRDRLRGP